jgi:hypothetical protein
MVELAEDDETAEKGAFGLLELGGVLRGDDLFEPGEILRCEGEVLKVASEGGVEGESG